MVHLFADSVFFFFPLFPKRKKRPRLRGLSDQTLKKKRCALRRRRQRRMEKRRARRLAKQKSGVQRKKRRKSLTKRIKLPIFRQCFVWSLVCWAPFCRGPANIFKFESNGVPFASVREMPHKQPFVRHGVGLACTTICAFAFFPNGDKNAEKHVSLIADFSGRPSSFHVTSSDHVASLHFSGCFSVVRESIWTKKCVKMQNVPMPSVRQRRRRRKSKGRYSKRTDGVVMKKPPFCSVLLKNKIIACVFPCFFQYQF